MRRKEEGSWKSSSGEALGPQPVSNLDPTYHTPSKTKHTFELVAVVQGQADERHVLEHLDVAWGNGVGEGRVRRKEEGSWKNSSGEALGHRRSGAIHVCNKLTYDMVFIVSIPTALHVQLLERHASKGPDVTWGSRGGGKT